MSTTTTTNSTQSASLNLRKRFREEDPEEIVQERPLKRRAMEITPEETIPTSASLNLRKRVRHEEEDEEQQPPLKRRAVEMQTKPKTILKAEEPNPLLTATENIVLSMLKQLLEDNDPPSPIIATSGLQCLQHMPNIISNAANTSSYKISFPTHTGSLNFYHPFTILHYLRCWDGYNEECTPHEVILLPPLSRSLINEICNHPVILYPSKDQVASAKELKERLERHRDLSEEADEIYM